MLSYKDINKIILAKRNKQYSLDCLRFFKCGKGQYGEGDAFLGIWVPECRKIAKQFFGLSLIDTTKLLQNKWHEVRLIALFILVFKFKKASILEKKTIISIYLNNIKYINNWDLVDQSAHYILGAFLENRNRNILIRLVKSKNLWERRISIVSTLWFIRKNDFNYTMLISKILLKDKEDLIHKACGWMLREVGKKDVRILKDFLNDNYKSMPRTTLRYAIERFSEKERKKYLEL